MNGQLIYKPFEILLVEDNSGDVFLLEKAFRESLVAARLSVATDGEEALAFLSREGRFRTAPQPDLILLDLNLPRMDGRAVLRRIKNDPRWKTIPVIVLTSSRLETDVRESYEMYANGYLMKPTDLRGFQETAKCLPCIDAFRTPFANKESWASHFIFEVLNKEKWLRDFWLKRAVLPPRP